jgi:MoaA/NifB/PqqE/SkfB family radical SAM enzyme
LARILICTNASLLTRELCEKFVELGLANLDFSLDGTDPVLVDGIRRGGSLEKLICNMRTLQEVKRERAASHPEVAAAMVLQRRNVHMLPGVVRLAAGLGATALSVNGLEPYRDEQAAEAVWTDASLVAGLEEAVTEAGRLARDLGVDLRIASFRPRPPGCLAVQRPVVLADGSVVPCSVLAYSRRSVLRIGASGAVEPSQGRTERVVFGNVNERSLRSIWKGAAYRAFRRSVSAGDFPAPCRDCLIKYGVICQGVSPEPTMDAAGNLAILR